MPVLFRNSGAKKPPQTGGEAIRLLLTQKSGIGGNYSEKRCPRESILFLKFHQMTNNKMIIVPQQNLLYVVDHDAGGASIYTNIPTNDPNKRKNFRSKETVAELYQASKVDLRLADGLFSSF